MTSVDRVRWYHLGIHLARAFSWNLSAVRVRSGEQEGLAAAGVQSGLLQRYLVWRRGLLIVLVVPCLLLALLYHYDSVFNENPPTTDFGRAWQWFQIAAMYCLPIAVLAALRTWRRPRPSAAAIRAGWLVSFLVPLLFVLFPADWLFAFDLTDAEELSQARLATKVFAGIDYFLELYVFFPTILLSFVFGMQRACLRLKTLLPGATVPGWFLVASSPLFPIALFPLFALFNQVAAHSSLTMGIVLLMASSFTYLIHARTFVFPAEGSAGISRVGWVQLISRLLFLGGCGFLAYFAFETKLPLPEMRDGQFTFAQPRTLLGFDAATSLIRPWDLDLVRTVFVEVLTRSLYTTILVSDLMLRVTMSVWYQGRRLEVSEAAAELDTALGRMHEELTTGRISV